MILSILISEPFFRTWNTLRFEVAKRNDAKPTFGKMLTYFSAIALFSGLGISVFINEAMYIMAPKEYQGATGVVALVVLSYVFYGIAHYFNLGIMLTYQTRYAAYIQMVVAGLNLLFNWFFIRHYGVIGAAIATVLSFLCLAILTLIISQRLYAVPFEYGRIATLFIVTAIAYALSQMIHAPFAWTICLKIAVMLIFPLLLFAGRFFTKQELDKAEELIKARFSKFGIAK
jgi:O-antigen/teichoic acid export membrane protein